jgi:uncharacterized protein (TIGR00255 family)
MTGYGKAIAPIGNKSYQIEIKTLNSKTYDCFAKFPSFLKSKEIELRNIIQQQLNRGKIEVFISVDYSQIEHTNLINKQLFAAYIKELKGLAEEHHISNTNLMSDALRNPAIINNSNEEITDEELSEVKKMLDKVLAEVNEFRIQEGNMLQTELEMRIGLIQKYLVEIVDTEKDRIDLKREKFNQKIEELKGIVQVDTNRLEQEILFYMERLDITEEVTRLRAHLDLFLNTMSEKSMDSGKRLNFIAQEIGREINTIGSKANDTVLQHIVVSAKDELEKIKEQINNVL